MLCSGRSWFVLSVVLAACSSPKTSESAHGQLSKPAKQEPAADRSERSKAAAVDVTSWEWEPAGQLPTARQEYALATSGSRIYVLGGYADYEGPSLAIAEVYDATTNAWSKLPPMHAERHNAAAIVLDDGRVLVTGGVHREGGAWPPTKVTEVFDPKQRVWSTIESPAHEERFAPILVRSSQGMIVLIGGQDDDEEPVAKVERFVPDTSSWAALPDLIPPREPDVVVPLGDGSLVAIGGFGPDGNEYLSPQRLRAGATQWEPFEAHSDRSNVAYAAGKDWILVSGGNRYRKGHPAQAVDTTERWTESDQTWLRTPGLVPLSIVSAGAALPDGTALIIGGSAAGRLHDGRQYDKVWVRTPGDKGVWVEGPPLPAPREGAHAVVLEDGSVFLLGGWSGVPYVHEALRLRTSNG